MAKVTIHLKTKEYCTLNEFALQEYRSQCAQAALTIQRQLLDLGLLLEKREDLNSARGQLVNILSNFALAWVAEK